MSSFPFQTFSVGHRCAPTPDLLTVQFSFPSPYAGLVPNLRLRLNERSSLPTRSSGIKLDIRLLSGRLAAFTLAERTKVLDCGLVPNL